MSRKITKAGFTLVELLVVIGIVVTVMAITVPMAQNVMVNNRALRCKTNLQEIHQALKMYRLDEGSVPPHYPDLNSGQMVGNGLQGLLDAGYMKGTETLHCPSDRDVGRGDEQYTKSYMSVDDNAAYADSSNYGQYNKYQYLTSRGVSDSSDPDYRRQLAPLLATGYPGFSGQWHPDDTAVVLWCYHHAERLTKANKGQYQVLYWDGTVRRMPASLFNGSGPVSEAWRVRPSDDATP